MYDEYNTLSNNQFIQINKELMRSCVIELIPFIDDISISEVLRVIDRPIDTEKFKQWVLGVNFTSKQNPKAYFMKSFKNEYDKGRFDLILKEINIAVIPLFNAFRKEGILIDDENDLPRIEDILINIIATNKASGDELYDFNHSIIDKHLIKNTKEYISKLTAKYS